MDASSSEQDNTDNAAERAISILGGPSAVAASLKKRGIEITPWAVNKWRRRVPSDRVLLLEEMTGGRVSRHDLRPDLYPMEHAA